jgi:hypothetical protein
MTLKPARWMSWTSLALCCSFNFLSKFVDSTHQRDQTNLIFAGRVGRASVLDNDTSTLHNKVSHAPYDNSGKGMVIWVDIRQALSSISLTTNACKFTM